MPWMGKRPLIYTRKKKTPDVPSTRSLWTRQFPEEWEEKDAIKKLHEIDPQVKAIVSSGYSKTLAMSDFGKSGFKAVIAKPYRITDLSVTVHQVLSEG